MSEPTDYNEECESVDLTEDEQSSEENYAAESGPLNFVDCSTTETISSTFTSLSPPPLTPIKKVMPLIPLKQTVKHKNVPNIIRKHEVITNQSVLSQKKLRKVKPRPGVLADTQDIVDVDSFKTTETICVDSDGGKHSGVPISQNVPARHQVTANDSQNPTIYSRKQPGKVVIIKKNNKYYKIVIPHNVMPNINQSIGPVLINIPEVGPLVIRNDPQVTKTNSIPVNQPFSLNLDLVQGPPKNSAQQAKKSKKATEASRKEIALCDKRFCWTFPKGKKRDLEGFSYTDRLGFTRADYQRARKCSTILNSILNKKRAELIDQMHEFNMFKESVKEENKRKLSKSNATGKTSRKRRTKNQLLPPLPNIPKDMNMALECTSYNPQNTDTAGRDTDYDCDLLLTKKVVILNGRDTTSVVKKRKLKKNKFTRQKRKTTKKMKLKKIYARKLAQHKKIIAGNKSFLLKPCYVHMVRDEIVEEAYRKYVGTMGFTYSQKPEVNADCKPKVGRKRTPKVNSNTANIKATITPKATELKKSKNIEEYMEAILNMFKQRTIKSEEKFNKEMNYLKPLLMINEHNLGIVNYSTQFAKSNIIYVVKENGHFPLSIVKNDSFVSALELGYIKLVDSGLFCRYVMGSGDFNKPGSYGHVSDHNYCIKK